MPKLPIKIIDRWLGMWSRESSHSIPDFYLSNAINMNQSDIGSISPSKQYSLFGDRRTGAGRILSTHTFTKRDGSQIPLQVRDDDTNTHLEWYNSVADAWEVLVADLTTGKKMAWAGFCKTTVDKIYFCNGEENYSEWNGAIGSVDSNTATVITLNETALTAGFSSNGSVIVNGTSYAYTGTSGKTLTGLTGLPTFTADEGVAEAADTTTHSSLPKCDIMIVADRRVWGAVPTSPTRIVFSKVGDGSDFTTSTNPDDPGTIDFVEGEGPITAMSNIRENIVIFKKDIVLSYRLDYPSSTTRTERIEMIREGTNAGAAYSQSVDKGNEVVYYASRKGGIKSIFLNKENDKLGSADLTDRIRPTLADAVFTSCALKYFDKDKVMMASFKSDSDAAQNDRCVVIHRVEQEGQLMHNSLSINDWVVNDFFEYEDELYFGGSYEPNCFKAFDGYTKDNTPFNAIATLKQYSFGSIFDQKEIAYIGVEGFVAPGQLIKFQAEYDTAGSKAFVEANFNTLDSDDKKFITEPQFNTIGTFSLGTEPIGSTVKEISEMNFFRFFFVMPEKHHPTSLQFTIWGDGTNGGDVVGNRWIIQKAGFYYASAGFEIDKKLKKNFTLS